jgi:hypothetical protein
MTITERDRRALVVLCAALVIGGIFWVATSSSDEIEVVGAIDSVPAAEKRLIRMRQLSSMVPGREQALSEASAELAIREKGILQAETAAQAQAQLQQVLRRLARKWSLELKGTEMGQTRKLGDHYGEVLISVSFDARIEQLVNLLAELTEQPELISTNELRITGAAEKDKSMPVRLTVSGVVSRALVPEKKGFAF